MPILLKQSTPDIVFAGKKTIVPSKEKTMSSVSEDSHYAIPKITDVLRAYSEIEAVHEACDSIPCIKQGDFDRLVGSIEADGVLTPVLIDAKGQLLDGRSRLCALHVLNRKLSKEMIETSTVDAWTVAKTNIARRHLTDTQRLLQAVDQLAIERREAAQRRREGAAKRRDTSARELVTNQVTSKTRNEPSINKVSRTNKVPRDKLRAAERICAKHPRIGEEMRRGELTIDEAVEKTGLSLGGKKKIKPKRIKAKRLKSRDGAKETQVKSNSRSKALMSSSAPDHPIMLMQVVREFLKTCEEENSAIDGVSAYPSLEQLAKYCGCNVDRLREASRKNGTSIGLRTTGILLGLAGVSLVKLPVSESSMIERLAIADAWLLENPATRGQLVQRLNQSLCHGE